MDLKTVIDSTPTQRKPRRTFTAELKQHLIELCQQPDTSVAKVAMQHQINTNLLHKWMSQSKSMSLALKQVSHQQMDFLLIVLNSPSRMEEPRLFPTINNSKVHIRIPMHEEQRSARPQMIEIYWPLESSSGIITSDPEFNQMIRIDEIWLSTKPMDMRAGTDTALAQVLKAFGCVKPHCAYLFCNRRSHRMKVLVHDGLGIWPR